MTAEPILEALAARPTTWRAARLKNVATLNPETLPENTDPETEFGYVDISSVTSDGRVLLPEEPIAFATAPSRARRIVRAGDILVSTVRTYLRAIARVPENGLVASTGFAAVRPTGLVDGGFLYWWLRSTPAVEQIVAQSVGVSYPAIAPAEVGRLGVPLPPPEDQRRIAEYLDRAYARIDDLAGEQQRLLDLLWERRRTAVVDAVGGGSRIGPRRPGPAWLASIPANWQIVRLRRVARLGTGHTPARNRPELWRDCTIPWITTGEVAQIRSDVTEVLHETREMISELGVAESSAVVHPAGTVVLCRTASAGFSAIMGADMATSQDFATWTCGPQLDPEFLLYCLRAMRPDLLGRLAMGSTHKTIYMPEIRSIEVPLPPVSEQECIVTDLRRTLAHIDRVRQEIGVQLDLLAEHRQALITAAVTGEVEAA